MRSGNQGEGKGMISFIAAFTLWTFDAGWHWWGLWILVAMFNLLQAVTK